MGETETAMMTRRRGRKAVARARGWWSMAGETMKQRAKWVVRDGDGGVAAEWTEDATRAVSTAKGRRGRRRQGRQAVVGRACRWREKRGRTERRRRWRLWWTVRIPDGMEVFLKATAIFEPAAKELVGYAFDSTKGYPGEGPPGVARHLHSWITVNVAGAHIIEKAERKDDDGAQEEYADTLRVLGIRSARNV